METNTKAPDAERQGATIATLVDEYLRERLVRPATAETYIKVAHRWTEEAHSVYLDSITRDAVLDWRNAILARARPETWNKYRRHMRALINYAIGRGWCESNPFREVPPARTIHQLKKTVETTLIVRALKLLDHQELGEETLRPAWFWAMVLRAYYFTGVRLRQLVELRWGDVDLANRTWRIRAEACKTHREWLLPIAPRVTADLELLLQLTTEQLGSRPSPAHQVYNVTLFYRRYKGRRMNDDQIGGFFQRLSASLGEKITPHRLRHTMATQLATHGDIRTLQELLGHTNISTTMGYIHPDIERMRDLTSCLTIL